MKRLTLLCLLATLLVGCGERRYSYYIQNIPVTDEERKALAEYEHKQVELLRVQSLAGHDQDWDDTLAQIHRNALRVCVKPRMWECLDYRETGRHWDLETFNEARARATAYQP